MRKSTLYLSLTAVSSALLIGLLALYPTGTENETQRRRAHARAVVKRLQLSDIALFTEAAYTRHPNLADRFVPFQNHPMAFSLFPSESLIAPPTHLLTDRPGAEPEGRP